MFDHPIPRVFQNRFSTQYRCFSASMLAGPNDRSDVEKGGKSRLNITYPMLFKLTNKNSDRMTHCGVLEFVADEGICYLPHWMMQNLLLEEGGLVQVESVNLQVATYSKFQPQSPDFLDITNPKAVLENALRNFACLTTGDVIAINYNEKIYELRVMETKPDKAVSIIECDMNVDFDAPLGYKEPERPVQHEESIEGEADHSGYTGEVGFRAFSGSGNRLDGKKKGVEPSPSPIKPGDIKRGIPNYEFKLACVNCVRWSNSGMYLASGGDDKLIMVWKRATYIGPSTVFGSSGKLANVEQWRCVSILRNHSGDVMDVAWSPHDAWLASCSVDNTVVIWNAVKFPEILATLRGHSGLVKGLTWDPVGKYIASQADDRSLKVWRTLDWQLETSITKPFDECGGTTHVLRLSWSPDGHYLVSAHAMNNSGPTAQIIEREGWKTNMDFVGHRKAVTVVKFNPKIFKKKQKNGSSTKPSCPYCCCAVGSKDRSLSVWLTCLKRPLVVIHELFDKSIMDISWTLNGLGILVCSMDGSVAFLDFSQDELGDPLSEEEKSRIHQSTYGKSLAIMTEAQLSTAVIENPEMLKYQRRQQQQQLDQKNATARETSSASSVTGVVNGESLEDIRKNLLKKQVETRTADGRRRITPLCIAQLDTGDFSTAFFNSIPLSSSLAGTMLSSPSSQQLLPLDSSTPSFGASKPCTEPVAATGARPTGESVTKDSMNATSTPAALSPSMLTTPSKIEPMKAFDSRFTERSKATPGAPSLTNVIPTAVERLKDQNLVKELRPRDLLESSSDSDEKVHLVKPSSLSKRKLELEVETVEKKKKGRPRKDSRLLPMSLSVQVSSDPSMYIEVENEVTAIGGIRLSRLKCNREGKEWETVLTSRVLTAAGSCDVVCVACEKRMLSVFSTCGRRLLPPILLPSPISTLHCTGPYVMALTAAATLSVCSGRQAARLFSVPHVVQQETTLAYLENQGLRKRELLKELLPVIGQNLRFQRLFTECQEQLDILRDK
ncbi:Protein HIRA [Cricetulus griseus]|uniref:Protein HIRA n=4 Tax=Euarchontoglires TaxID=314146 RepID=G3HEN3_CRIGR|nr:Protein HIRA [Cricetulus griseus]